MIYGNIKDISNQKLLTKRLKRGLDFLLAMKASAILRKPEGYVEKETIDGDNIFALHQVYKTRSPKVAKLESHRQYIDLQFIWKGEEAITVTGLKGLKIVDKYDRKNDFSFYKYEKGVDLIMSKGDLAVFFPSDAHAPGLTFKKASKVYKTVIKVKI